jgi:hypothetical protein
MMTEQDNSDCPPWSWQPSLEFLLRDAGIGFGSFVAHLRNNATDKQMASDFGVGMQTIRHFRQHFEAFGIDSIVGQD